MVTFRASTSSPSNDEVPARPLVSVPARTTGTPARSGVPVFRALLRAFAEETLQRQVREGRRLPTWSGHSGRASRHKMRILPVIFEDEGEE